MDGSTCDDRVTLVDRRFGRWTVLGPQGRNKDGHKTFLCRCDCGTEKYVLEKNLLGGKSKSCGCSIGKGPRGPSKDLTGMQFDQWTVIGPWQRRYRGNYFWNCRCSCGKEHFIRDYHLLNGISRNCGCNKRRNEDLTGQRFGRWTVIGPFRMQESGRCYWQCRCDCGVSRYVSEDSLLGGRTVSCGCGRQRQLSDETVIFPGKVFGEWVAVEPVEKQKDQVPVWRCRCSCGQEREVMVSKLIAGKSNSCGCRGSIRALAGKVIGNWTVSNVYRTNESGTRELLCKCKCGEERYVRVSSLKNETSLSCGKPECRLPRKKQKETPEPRSRILRTTVVNDLQVQL